MRANANDEVQGRQATLYDIYMLTRDVKPQKNTPSVMPGAFGNSIHAKRDAIPSLRIG
jgi:hypothetical protein